MPRQPIASGPRPPTSTSRLTPHRALATVSLLQQARTTAGPIRQTIGRFGDGGSVAMERMRGSRLTRRRVLGGVAGGGAFALGGSRLQEALAARKAPAVLQGGGTFTYWGGLIFSEEANNLLVEEITAWGEANDIETEVVMINQNETNQKVSAAVESNTM